MLTHTHTVNVNVNKGADGAFRSHNFDGAMAALRTPAAAAAAAKVGSRDSPELRRPALIACECDLSRSIYIYIYA